MSDLQNLLENIQRRLPGSSSSYVNVVGFVCDKYGLEPKILDFAYSRFTFSDLDGRKVQVVQVDDIRKGFLYVTLVDAGSPDILLFESTGVIVGWLAAEKLSGSPGQKVSVAISSLDPAPEECRFAQKCPHMSVYGGWYDGRNWQCLGCGAELVFNDTKLVRNAHARS